MSESVLIIAVSNNTQKTPDKIERQHMYWYDECVLDLKSLYSYLKKLKGGIRKKKLLSLGQIMTMDKKYLLEGNDFVLHIIPAVLRCVII